VPTQPAVQAQKTVPVTPIGRDILLFSPPGWNPTVAPFRHALAEELMRMKFSVRMKERDLKDREYVHIRFEQQTGLSRNDRISQFYLAAEDAVMDARWIANSMSQLPGIFVLEIRGADPLGYSPHSGADWQSNADWRGGSGFRLSAFSRILEEAEWFLSQIPVSKADEMAKKRSFQGLEGMLGELRTRFGELRNMLVIELAPVSRIPQDKTMPFQCTISQPFSQGEIETLAALLVLDQTPPRYAVPPSPKPLH
jgi:hypothetical protein